MLPGELELHAVDATLALELDDAVRADRCSRALVFSTRKIAVRRRSAGVKSHVRADLVVVGLLGIEELVIALRLVDDAP